MPAPPPLVCCTPQAARARCTLGEISSVLEDVWGRHAAAGSVQGGVYVRERGGEKDVEVRKPVDPKQKP